MDEYQKAWGEYKFSSTYKSAFDAMLNAGMQQTTIENILEQAFSAGYKAK